MKLVFYNYKTRFLWNHPPNLWGKPNWNTLVHFRGSGIYNVKHPCCTDFSYSREKLQISLCWMCVCAFSQSACLTNTTAKVAPSSLPIAVHLSEWNTFERKTRSLPYLFFKASTIVLQLSTLAKNGRMVGRWALSFLSYRVPCFDISLVQHLPAVATGIIAPFVWFVVVVPEIFGVAGD